MYAGRIVEFGASDTIFAAPEHPYTWGLLSSVTRLDRVREDRLKPIPGTPPSLLNVPPGCAFSPRCTYRNRNGIPCQTERPELDRFILSSLASLVADVNREMQAYRLYNVVPRLVSYIDVLTNWYIRLSRRRFWKSDDDADKADAYATLYEVLVTFAQVMAPFLPFLSEYVYQHLVKAVDAGAPASVHFCDFPVEDRSRID